MQQVPHEEMQQELRAELEQGFDTISEITTSYNEDDDRVITEISDVFRDVNPGLNMTRLYNNLKDAQQLHLGHYRNSGEPYIAHVASVGSILASWGLPENVIYAGNLHDCVEENGKDRLEVMNSLYVTYDVTTFLMVVAMTVFEDNPDVKDRVLYGKIDTFKSMFGLEYLSEGKSADGIHNLYSKKHMIGKNGMSALERQQRYASVVGENILPLAREVDEKGELMLEVGSYIEYLMKK